MARVGAALALFLKAARGEPMVPVDALALTHDGIVGQPSASPWRQVLLIDQATLDALTIPRGALRENVVVAANGLHELPSGTTVRIGDAALRLTFHCEPCARIRAWGEPRALLHRRGYFAQVTEPATIRRGDAFRVGAVEHEPIPYGFRDRIAHVLAHGTTAIESTALLAEAGFHRSHARALPRALAGLDETLRSRVRWKSEN